MVMNPLRAKEYSENMDSVMGRLIYFNCCCRIFRKVLKTDWVSYFLFERKNITFCPHVPWQFTKVTDKEKKGGLKPHQRLYYIEYKGGETAKRLKGKKFNVLEMIYLLARKVIFPFQTNGFLFKLTWGNGGE